MSTLLNIVEAIVLFVVSLPFAVADDVSGVDTNPDAWTQRQTGSAGVGVVMFMAFALLCAMVFVFAISTGSTGIVVNPPACYTPGGMQVVCG